MASQSSTNSRGLLLFVGFSALAGALAFLGGLYPTLHLHIYATCMVVLYGATLWWCAKQDDVHGVELHPESVYIVGYIATIAGLAGIAVQIGRDPTSFGDYRRILPIVLNGGGAAVVSTLVGLVFMNILKMITEQQAHEIDAEERHIGELSRRFAEEFARSLGSQESTAGFKENLDRMSSQLMAGAAGIERLQNASIAADENIARIGDEMERFLAAMTHLQNVAVSMGKIWGELPLHAEAARDLQDAMSKSSISMNSFKNASDKASLSLEHLASVGPALGASFSKTLTQIDNQLTKIGDSNDVLVRLLEWARNASLVVSELHAGFSDIRNIKDNLQQVATNLGDANRELLKFNNEAIKLGRSGSEFSAGVTEMSQSIIYAITNLSRIGDHIKVVGQMADQLRQGVDENTLVQFNSYMVKFVANADALNHTLDSSNQTLNEAQEAVGKFRDVTLELAKTIPLMRAR